MKKKLKKTMPMPNPRDKDGDDNEDTGDEDEGTKKSQDLSADDLQKGIARLDDFITRGDAPSRKQQLLHKAMEEELSKSETEELYGLMGGSADASKKTETNSLGETLTKSLTSDETINDVVEVSDYLEAQHSALVKSLSDLGDHVESMDSRQNEFNLLLARTVSDTAKLVKSMSEQMGVIVAQPARAPKARLSNAAPQALQKSFAGAEGSTQLSKRQVLDGLDTLMEKSMASGQKGVAACGEDLAKSIAKFEMTNAISPRLLAEVRSVIGTQAA